MPSQPNVTPAPSTQRDAAAATGTHSHPSLRLTERLRQAIILDWQHARVLPCGAALLGVTLFVVAAYYLNHPGVEYFPDSNGYIGAAAHILARGQLADAVRLPGYPLLMALVFLVGGRGNFALISAVQGALFVAATLEVYALALLLWRRTWVALVIGLLVGTNVYLLKYVKPITSDGLALVVVVTLALAAVVCARTLRARHLWLVAGVTLLLFMTRPEWIYVPVPLFGLLLVVAAQRGRLEFRRLLPHALGALLVLYAALGLYVYRNAVDAGYAGVTTVQNVNLLGKVMQYHMQDEAPPQYAPVARVVDAYLARGGTSPWQAIASSPLLGSGHSNIVGAYAQAVIAGHPIEFVARSLPILFTSSSIAYLRNEPSPIAPGGPFDSLLALLELISTGIYLSYIVFPFAAVPWLAPFVWRHANRAGGWLAGVRVEPVAMVAALGLYALAVTTLGGYGDYARIHTSFDPLVIVVVWGSVLTLIAHAWAFARGRRLARPAPGVTA